MGKKNQAGLYITAFASGMISLGVELSASRLLAPHFGDSHPVWAAIISLILLYLTAGYFIGGRWADRSPHPATLYRLLAWASLLVGIVPFVARPVMVTAAQGFADYNVALLAGPFLVVLLLFSVPVTLMGCVSPFVIRLLMERVEQAGNVAGRTYAISTAGSLLGTLLPVFLLIPTVGTRTTFVVFSLLLMAVALVGLARAAGSQVIRYLWMPLLILLLALILRGQPIKPQAGTIYETESAYNYIQVVEQDGRRYLYLNEGQGVHSIYDLHGRRVGGTWDYFLIAPFFNPAPFSPERIESLAMIGLAAGTIPQLYTNTYGPIPIDGVEIDPEIVHVGQEFFAMDEPNLNVVVADGRAFLSRSTLTYSVVGIDAYRLPYIPWHLTTVEFFQAVRDHLAEDGVVAINVGRTPGDDRLVETIAATLAGVFPSVHAIDVPASFNTIIVATVQPSEAENLLANRPLMADATLQQIADEAWSNLRPIAAGGMVLTDDRAPVEMLTHAIVLNYVLGR
ncbi:MAG: fused MFS/spermidine synthase [Anaerolineae bacterium]|nr:fused MFS/spermidine synthase [Anaerolineae bacterium]